jgi:DNA-directed RNA polymerase subunit RPC12/RpoP
MNFINKVILMTSASALYASSVIDHDSYDDVRDCPLCSHKAFVVQSTTVVNKRVSVTTLELTADGIRKVESEGEEEEDPLEKTKKSNEVKEDTSSKPEENQEKESEDVCK